MNLKTIKNVFDYKCTQKLFISILISCAMFNLFCADWLITNSGTYILNDDLLSTNADSNGAIRISSSFVTLDLNGRFVYQNNATAGANGIVVDAGLTDVIIQNGTIVNFRRSGILVNAGCSVIKLQDLMIENCAIRGIELIGTAANKIIKSEVNNCKIFNCCTSATSSDSALMLTQCTDVAVNYCRISDISSTALTSVAIFNTCVACNFKNIFIDNNSSNGTGGLVGFSLVSCNNCKFNNCVVRNFNIPNGFNGSVLGFNFLTSLSFNCLFENCKAIKIVSPNNANAVGFSTAGFLSGNSLNTLHKKCLCMGFVGGQVAGFTSQSSTFFSAWQDCISLGHTGNLNSNATSGFIFFLFTGGALISNCFASYNSTSQVNNTCNGIALQGTGNTRFFVVNSDFIGNTSSATDTNSNGIRDEGGSNNVFVQNVAARNGSTANTANISGVAGGSVDTTGGSTTMNSPTAPWTNLSIKS